MPDSMAAMSPQIRRTAMKRQRAVQAECQRMGVDPAYAVPAMRTGRIGIGQMAQHAEQLTDLAIQYLNQRRERQVGDADLVAAEKRLEKSIADAGRLLADTPAEARPGKDCGYCPAMLWSSPQRMSKW